MEASITPEETLHDILGARARRTPADRLVLDIVGGALISAAAVWARPAGWGLLLAASACFVCYGVWAFAERQLRASGDAVAVATTSDSAAATSASRGWEIAWRISAALGIFAFVALLFTFLGVALGPIIS
jgi:hypothetical protein